MVGAEADGSVNNAMPCLMPQSIMQLGDMGWIDVQVSRKRLEMAMQVLERQNVYDPDLLMYRTALGMVRSASLNCYVFDVSPSWCNMTSTHHLRL